MTIPEQLQNEEFKFIALNNDKSPKRGVGWKKPENQFSYKDYQSGNIGIIAGYNNLRIIDLDVKVKNSDGTYDISKDLISKAQQCISDFKNKFGNSLIVKTPSDGYHIYIKSDLEINQSYFKFNKEIDGEYRSTDCYVATLPTIVGDKTYSVLINSPIKEINKIDLANFLVNYANEDKIYGTRTDLTQSGDEMSVIMSLIKRGVPKDKIMLIMSKFEKWSNSPQSYRDLTIKNALKILHRTSLPNEEIEVKLNPFNIGESLKNGIPEIKYIIKPFLPIKKVTMFIAPPSNMKTFLAQHIAVSCATGSKFLGEFESKKEKVLYLDEENGEEGMLIRINMLLNGAGLKHTDLENLDCLSMENLTLDNDSTYNGLIDILEQNEYKLVIFDSMSRFFQGDENSSNDIKLVFKRLKYMTEKYNVTLLLLHHTTKSNPRDARGSGDFKASPDNQFSIKLNKNNKTVSILSEKLRFSAGSHAHIAEFESDEKTFFKFIYSGAKEESKLQTDYDYELLESFFNTLETQDFITKDVKKFFEINGRTAKNAPSAILKLAVADKKVTKINQGKYKLNEKRLKKVFEGKE